MTVMDCGRRDRYVTIEQLTDSVGDSGFPVETWSTLRQVFASRQDVPRIMNEQFVNHQLSVPVDTVWQIQYFTDMDPETLDIPKVRRLNYGGRAYDITMASLVNRKTAIDLTTVAKQG